MKTFAYVIQDEIGIHARPAGMLTKAAKEFNSQIILSYNGKEADAKRLMTVMALGVKHGAQVEVCATGEDEEEAIAALQTFFKENL